MRTYKIYLIRHGMTSANIEGRYVGSTDVDLCEEGIAELLELKEKYEYPNVAAVYSSPLSRAVRTSKIIYPDFTPVAVPDLSEHDFGEYENKTIAELKNEPQFIEWVKEKGIENATLSIGENPADFQARVIRGFNSVIMDMMKQKISDAAVVTHGGVIATLLAACGLPRQSAADWLVGNGCGYTAMINASLWQGSGSFEIFTPLPYGLDKERIMFDYQTTYGDLDGEE